MVRAIHNSNAKAAGAGIGVHLLLLLAGLAAWPTAALAQSTQPAATEEYQIKAACLLNFAQFIEWPASAFSSPDAPIVVGVLGDDPFGSALEQTFQGETIHGRSLEVKRAGSIDELKNCQMIFICKSEKDRVSDILERVRDANIVTVGEVDQMAQRGGIINFYLSNNKIRFEINAGAAERKNLRINSQLLKRAKIVSTK